MPDPTDHPAPPQVPEGEQAPRRPEGRTDAHAVANDAGDSAASDVTDAKADLLSAMTPRFNLLFRSFASRFFRGFDLDHATVERLRALEERGSVVYVMRYASRLDYFLFNAVFLREGLRLSSFANGIRFFYYRPWFEALRIIWRRPRGVAQDIDLVRARDYSRELSGKNASFFLFLRTASLRAQLRGRKGAIEAGKSERDLIEEVVGSAWNSDHPVHVVPLALFWRMGPRARRRFLNLSYGAANRPTDLAKVTAFLINYRGLHVKVGEPIDLLAFIAERREVGAVNVARTVRRAILTFLYREEKVVEGPVLQPRHRVQEIVVRMPAVEEAIRVHAEEQRVSVEQARLRSEKMFREIAANMNSTFLAVLDIVVGALIRRLFARVEVSGIEKVLEYAKGDPLVLVPSHRSYFDFLLISLMMYGRHITPPHIAARENMAFGPFGFLWRRAGAFFLRKSFDDPLYKAVFRTYVAYLIKEGFTQEFFIEGGRSRTGKALPPRLGMLSWDIEAFLESGRRDLFFVPIAITYERLVEEGAMVGELEGEEKREESMLGLVRARKFLQRRFGTVYMNFGEPFSLADALGPRRERFTCKEDPGVIAERRIFVETLGNRILERINWAVVPSATAIAACALLGERRRGVFRPELARRMQQVVDLLRLQDVRLTPALVRDEGDFSESIASLQRMDLIRTSEDPRGELLYYEEPKRRVLDIYRNGVLHFLAVPSFLARRLLSHPSLADLHADLSLWLELFYREIYVNRGEVLAAHFQGFIDYFERLGWIAREDGIFHPTEKGGAVLEFLAEQTRTVVESYYATFTAVLSLDEPKTAKELRKVAEEQFGRARLLGEVTLPEAANPVAFGNAVDLLREQGILAVVPDEPGGQERRETAFVRGEAFEELTALCERLASALAAR